MAVAVVCVVLLGGAWLFSRSVEVAPQPAATGAREEVIVPASPVLLAVGAPVPVSAPVRETLGARALASPQTTVQTQLSLLEDNQYDLFVQTFVDAQRARVTPEVFEACRTRIKQVPVRPDWEMAEQRVVDGRSTSAVSIFGKSLTTFTELDGRWLAGSRAPCGVSPPGCPD